MWSWYVTEFDVCVKQYNWWLLSEGSEVAIFINVEGKVYKCLHHTRAIACGSFLIVAHSKLHDVM